VKKRFSGNADCQNAYKNYLCWLNFPRCNDESESLIMCRSVCENYFKSCKVGPPTSSSVCAASRASAGACS
jgi:hypothetical protein